MTDDLEPKLTAAVEEMVLGSPHLTALAGGRDEVRRMLGAIENVWLEHDGVRVHLDLHRAAAARATVVFQPGSGAHARVYFLLGGLLARSGYHVLAIDRPGHGLSGGMRGHCTVEQAIAVAGTAIEHARRSFGLPVVLMGSSMGGLLTVFGLLRGLAPDLAVAHNFVYPGKLFSLRLRARWILRHRTRPYPITELVHGFEKLSDDPAIATYVKSRTDPGFAWELSAPSVASLFGFNTPANDRTRQVPTLVLSGSRDKAIPAWATRFFTWLSGLSAYEVKVIAGAGHLAASANGDVLVVWTQQADQDGSGIGVFAQRYGSFSCPATPSGTCGASAKGKLLIKDDADDTKDKLIWKWGNGSGADTQSAFGDPTGSTANLLCLYDDNVLKLAARVPAGATAWAPLGTTGYKFKADGTTSNGIQKVKQKSGAAGTAKILAKGKGSALPLPAPAGAQFFNQTSAVTVQMFSSTVNCWGNSFTAAQSQNEASQFKAKF